MAIKRQTKHKLSRGTGVVFCALIYAILFLPIVIVVANSFNGNTEKPYLSWGGFSLRWYVHLFQNGPLLASFGNTMVLAITTTVLATVLGTLGAWACIVTSFPVATSSTASCIYRWLSPRSSWASRCCSFT